jgi:prevent-host-death family protein
MVKRYSIAEASDNFTGIVHEAESGDTVEVTRHGKPVAVLVAPKEHERSTEANFAEDAMEPEEWLERDRNPSPGRDFSW